MEKIRNDMNSYCRG